MHLSRIPKGLIVRDCENDILVDYAQDSVSSILDSHKQVRIGTGSYAYNCIHMRGGFE